MYHLEDYAIEVLGAPQGWRVGAWHRGMEEGDDTCPPNTIKIHGAIYGVLKSGKRRGRPNHKKPVAGTQKTYFVLEADIRAWQLAKEQRTGCCKECEGTGQRWHSTSVAEGTKYCDCERCGATGKVTL